MTTTAPLFGLEQEDRTSDDYYTPSWVFETLGVEFDLDVAAPPGGVSWIPAKRFYTKADDGLAQPWEGRVWMNPPYSGVTPWWNKFRDHGNGIALLPLAKSGWTINVWQQAEYVAFPDRWFNFTAGSISYPVMFVGLGLWTYKPLRRIGFIR